MSNRLQYEQSPYLLQHKDNPVDWWAWSDDAFAEARAEEIGAALASAGFARFELGVYRSPADRAREAATAARGR